MNRDPWVELNPDRQDVDELWLSLIAGDISREDVRRLTNPSVVQSAWVIEMMAEDGLLDLHGFALRDRDGNYLCSDEQIRDRRELWHQQCADYDRDPSGYMARVRAEQMEVARLERLKKGEPRRVWDKARPEQL